MKIGIAFSTENSSRQAGEKAAKMAVKSSGPPVMTFLFTTDDYNQNEVVESVKEVIGDSKLAGFCCGGIITSQAVLQQGVGVFTLSGKEIRVATSLQEGLSADPYALGQRAGEALLDQGIENGTVFIFPDGFGANISEMVRGLYNTMGPGFKYMGGGAGDNLRFFKTYQFTEEGIASDALAVAVVNGISVETALGHGWSPKGEPIVIGNVKGKTVIEIDGKPAFEAYKERFGDISIDNFSEYGMRHPIGFPDISGHYLIRDPLGVNDDQSIDFVTEVPVNAIGYLMEGDVENLVETAGRLAETVYQKLEQPQFVFCLDCISRYLLLAGEFERELESISKSLPENVPIFGALTFGEIGSHMDVPHFHNKSLVLAVAGK